MKCPRCQQDNATAQKFCGECGTLLTGASHATPYADLRDENEGLSRSLREAHAQASEALARETALVRADTTRSLLPTIWPAPARVEIRRGSS